MDIVSFNEAATANGRIEKFIENPDSNSGIVTVPKVIGAGENITIPEGRVAVLPNVQVDGTLNVLGEVFIPAGSTVDMGNGLAINGEKVVMSVPTSYHLLQGNLAVDNTVITQGFNTTLYTGNGSTQSINTGIDMATQWGNDASEKFGGLVWIKDRDSTNYHNLQDTLQGTGYRLSSNSTASAQAVTTTITSFNSNGFTTGIAGDTNASGHNIASWNFQTTHRVSGTTNHGKAYTCHYNPYTGFTIVKYDGSGIIGHEIPHHLGRKLGFATVKSLSTSENWQAHSFTNGRGELNTNIGFSTENAGNTNMMYISNAGSTENGNGLQYIMYGWANSYLDEANKLIGNYEVGVYQGTGVSGNKITTRGKPAWVMIKRLDVANEWTIFDNKRVEKALFPNLPTTESSGWTTAYNSDGFTINNTDANVNASGGQYLYMVAYDTNANGGGSYYPKTTDTANVQINNALIPIAKGTDINGLKNVMLSKNETITGLTYTAGKNYVYYDANGVKGVKYIAPNYGTTNPANGGDFYNVLENKWYTSAHVEILEGRNYLNHIVHADNDGGVLYVEELPKVEYKDVIKANEYQGKNACTAWVNFDGTTTPPTIKDSYNVSKVIRTATGRFTVYFEKPMDNTNYCIDMDAAPWTGTSNNGVSTSKLNSIDVSTRNGASEQNYTNNSVKIFGGKN